MVREGAGATTLDLALGHIPGTALPGQPGNIGVAGHRDSLFRGLGRIHKTDRIEFQTLTGDYQYEVESTSVVKPQTVSVLDPGQYPEITLVTCYPFRYVGSAPDRFIVKARLVSRDPLARSLAPEPVKPARVPERRKAQSSARRVFFHISEGHSTTLVPGISIGLEWADAASQRVNGWMWVMPDRRTIWLTRQYPREPVIFYGHEDGKRRELVITSIGRKSVSGYLQLSGG
jgi:LPXTG-site transpeptidase (sortase) family protein